MANSLGLPVFTPTIKNYIKDLLGEKTQVKDWLISSFPFVFGFTFAVFMPSITAIFWFLGLVICNFNGFIIPSLLEFYGSKKSRLKQLLISWLILGYLILGVLGTYYKLTN